MRTPGTSSHCHYGAHHRCADGAAIACRCSCHGQCVCASHPSRLRPLIAAGVSPETDPAVQVVDAGITRHRDNGVALEGRSVGEARPALARSFPRVLP